MKFLLLWAVAACVAATDDSCEEYCACLSSGVRKGIYQPGCDCKYKDAEIQDQFENTAIYYEPADYVPIQTLFYNQPFYILNPFVEIRKYSIDTNNKVLNQPEHTHPAPNTDTEIKIENSPESHKRKEKDIQGDSKRRGPIYLDINVEPKDSEISYISTNLFNAGDIKLTEPNLLECTDLYTVLNSRKSNDQKYLDSETPNPFHKYEHLSNTELMNNINHKCSDIFYIVEKSQNEIKEKRPKKSGTPKINSIQRNNEIHTDKDLLDSSKYTSTYTDLPTQDYFSAQSKSGIEDCDNNQEATAVYTKSVSNINMADATSTLVQVLSSPVNSILSNQGVEFNSSDDSFVKDNVKDDPTKASSKIVTRETYPAVTSVYTVKEYPLDTEINELPKYTFSITNVPCTTPTYDVGTSTNYEDQSDSDYQRTEKGEKRKKGEEFKERETVEDNRNHKHEEAKASLVKIVTREFNNNSALSFINGTEDLSNGDFEDEVSLIDLSKSPTYDESTPTEIETTTPPTTPDTFGATTKSPDLSGRLYFLYNSHQIPARFVQNPNGSLHLGIDGVTLCDKLTQDGQHKSVLLTTLCNCYKSDKCITKK